MMCQFVKKIYYTLNQDFFVRRFIKGSRLSENRLTDQTVAFSVVKSVAEERSIMAMTGHKSTEMVRRYIKEANLFKNKTLNKIKI